MQGRHNQIRLRKNLYNYTRKQISLITCFHKSRLTPIYVLDSTIADEVAGVTTKELDAVKQNLEAKGKSYLDYLVRLASASGVQAEQVIRHGTPYGEIVNPARKRDVDLIVIGRVGCRSARCALAGSVTERVIEYADCPVLVVSQHRPVGCRSYIRPS